MTETEDVRRLMAEGRMLRSEEGQGRDTTMCGDPKSWAKRRLHQDFECISTSFKSDGEGRKETPVEAMDSIT